MINKKPIGKKPIVRPRAPKAPAQADGETPEDEAPTPPPQSRAHAPEDELALQSIETNSYPGEHFKRPDRAKADDRPRRRFDFDASNLLIFAWIGLGLFVVGAVCYFFYNGRSSIDETSKRSDVPAAKSVETDKKPSYNVNNPANKAGYEQINRYMRWAYSEGSALNGEQMSARMLKEAPLTGVDDPDVLEYREKLCEFFRLGKDHPLIPFENISGGSDLTSARGADTADSLLRKKVEKRYTELAMALKGKYK